MRGQTARDGLRTVFTHSQVARLSSDLRFDAAALPSSLAFDQWLGLFRYFALTHKKEARSRQQRQRLPRRRTTKVDQEQRQDEPYTQQRSQQLP